MFGTNSDGNYWDACKKGFATWERETAKYLDTVIRSPALLTPTGQARTSTGRRARASSSVCHRGIIMCSS